MRKTFTSIQYTRGQAVIVATLFFLVISLTIIFGLVGPILKQYKLVVMLGQSREGFYVAEAGIEDVIYKLKNGIAVSSTETLTVNGHTATVDVADDLGSKVLTSEGDRSGLVRKISTRMTTGVGTSFAYGVQTGQGGFTLDNNAGVYGNVYSNGDITGSNNTFISGSAVAASSFSVGADQVNDTPIPPPNTINFRNLSASEDFAQSFQVSTTSEINKVELYVRKTASGSLSGSATVRITSNSGSNPGSTIASASLNLSNITQTYGWVEVANFSSNPLLIPGNTYWVVIDNSTFNGSNYLQIGANNTYTSGQAKTGRLGSSWTATSLDGYFKIYLGGVPATIANLNIGQGGVGNAHANTVNNSTVAGTLYCQNGTGNNQSCNTSLADPVPVAFPISDANIAEWKADAEDGGIINGNYTPVGASSTLGPVKINGNLTLPSDHALTITGTVWVTGNIVMPNNNDIQLSSGYGPSSGIIMADGYIRLDNNVDFYGSGNSSSYILLLTTSGCPTTGSCAGNDAIELSNNVGTNGDRVIVNAQQGTINFGNNVDVKEATGHRIHLSNNVTITYESGLINVNFTSGPGGTWNMETWREVE